MLYITKNEAQFYSGDGFSGMDYPLKDQDIDFAVIKVNGRSPKYGYQVNTGCKELLYIIEGYGLLSYKGNDEKIEFKQGDAIIIDKGELYAFDGDFQAGVSCTPAWNSEQHKYVD